MKMDYSLVQILTAALLLIIINVLIKSHNVFIINCPIYISLSGSFAFKILQFNASVFLILICTLSSRWRSILLRSCLRSYITAPLSLSNDVQSFINRQSLFSSSPFKIYIFICFNFACMKLSVTLLHKIKHK